MDGRVLYEGLAAPPEPPPKADESMIEANADLGILAWHQYLKLTRIGKTVYYTEGNGRARPKSQSTED
jgi:hypothetical protein